VVHSKPQPLTDDDARLAQFLRWLIPVAFVFSFVALAGGWGFGDAAGIRTGLLILACAFGFVVAREILFSGRRTAAVGITVGAILAANVLATLNQPLYYSTTVIPLLAVGVAGSMLEGRRLVALLLIAWLTTAVSAIALALMPKTTVLPDWLVTGFATTAIIAVIGLHLLLLWHAGERHRKALEQVRLAAEAEAATELRHRALVEHLPGIVYVAELGAHGAWHFVSPQIERILGFPADAWIADPGLWARQLHPADRDHVVALEEGDVVRDDHARAKEYRMISRTGDEVWIREEEVVVGRDEAGRPKLVQGVIIDITERKRLEEELAHRAAHDPLTSLPNRTVFRERLVAALARPGAVSGVAVLFIDVDDFKLINDTMGHAAGDELLIAVARRLELAIRQGDVAARAGGDEFTILVDGLAHEDDATRLADRIAGLLARPVAVQGREMTIAVSIGIAVFEDPASGPDELLAQADAALYEAKARGKARHQRFRAELSERAWRRLELEAELRTAIDRGEFVLHFQPIVGLASGALEGLEALVRWQHPVRELIGPGEFIGICEQSGLIVPLGRWILDEALRSIRALDRRPATRGLPMSVNLSPRQVTDPGFVENVRDSLRRHKVSPSRLKLEITESVLLLDDEETAVTIEGIQALGVELVVDDFGTGYSSLSYLKRLPVAGLKIDRSFVAGLGHDAQDAAIVSAATAFARALGLSVTGEGIETPEQLAELRRLGCELGQGYLFARPMPLDELARLVTGSGWAAAAALALPAAG